MIAITGANGLLGSYIVRQLLHQGETIKALTRKDSDLRLLHGLGDPLLQAEADVLDLPQLLRALADVTAVVHVAGLVSFNPRRRDLLNQVNVEGTRNVVNACLKLGIPKLIHISSVAALGRTKGSQRVNEENKWTVSEHNTHYAESKYLGEIEVYRGMEEGLQVSILNPSVILAPVKSGQSSAQIFSYIEEEGSFYGDGLINYVDVRDVAVMASQLLRANGNGERFIASAGALAMKELMAAIAQRLNKKTPSIKVGRTLSKVAAVLEEMRAGLTRREPIITRQSVKILDEQFFFDNTKAQEKLKIRFRTLDETLDWCCSELKKAE